MARTINFEFRKGSGAPVEIMFGEVTLTPTLMHSVGTSAVIPAPTKADLVDGKASMPNVAPSPEPVAGLVEWAYKVVVKDRHGKHYEWLVGVPDALPAINFIALPRYSETKPPLFGQGPQGVPGTSATIAVGTVASGTTPAVTNTGTSTDAVLNFTLQQGPTGPPGAGFNFQPNDKPVADLPDTYFIGYNLHQIGGTASGWPLTYATVVTVRRIAGRTVQTISNFSNRILQRAESAGTWTAFVEIASNAVATPLLNGLMSSEDKGKLDAATPELMVNTIVSRDGEGRTKTASPIADFDSANRLYVHETIGSAMPSLWDFGAKGDGVTDDSLAMQAFVDSGGGYIPPRHYRLDQPIDSSTNQVKVYSSGGKVTYTGGDTTSFVFTLSGTNTVVQGLEITSSVECRGGIKTTGDNPSLRFNYIHDLFAVGNCTGISVTTPNGMDASHNWIDGIHTTVALGGTTSYSRGISLNGSGVPATKKSYIQNNTINRITGQEGDSISVLFSGGDTLPYLDGLAVISGNTLEIASRRYVKIQATNCEVTSNVMSEPTLMTFAAPSFAIASIESSQTLIKDNIIRTSLGGISISGITTIGGTVRNKVISNEVESLATSGGAVGIYAPDQHSFSIQDNTIHNFNRAIGAAGSAGAITRNTRTSSHGFGKELVTVTSSSSRVAVTDNFDFSPTDSKKIENLSVNGINERNTFLGVPV